MRVDTYVPFDLIHRLPNAHCSCEVDDGLDVRESSGRGHGIPDVPMDEGDAVGKSRRVSEVHLGFEAVEDDDVVAAADQMLDEVRPNESSASSD